MNIFPNPRISYLEVLPRSRVAVLLVIYTDKLVEAMPLAELVNWGMVNDFQNDWQLTDPRTAPFCCIHRRCCPRRQQRLACFLRLAGMSMTLQRALKSTTAPVLSVAEWTVCRDKISTGVRRGWVVYCACGRGTTSGPVTNFIVGGILDFLFC